MGNCFLRRINRFCRDYELPEKVAQSVQIDPEDSGETNAFFVEQDVLAEQNLIDAIPRPTAFELRALGEAKKCEECEQIIAGHDSCPVLQAILSSLSNKQRN